MNYRNSLLNDLLKKILFHAYFRFRGRKFTNIEGLPNWNFSQQAHRHHAPGISVMLRVKNESSKIRMCLASIHELFDEIVVIDNGSVDDTRALVERFIVEHKASHIKILDYPHQIARCGDEHLETPENSVHSLAYYYNWCLAQCSKAWVFKWDADMVVPVESRGLIRDTLRGIRASKLALWNIPGQTVYIDGTGVPWASQEEINHEERAFPNTTMIYYRKAEKWERLQSPFTLHEEYPSGVLFYELKDTREDEFSNWTQTSEMSPRKVKEYQNYMLVKAGKQDSSLFARTSLP